MSFDRKITIPFPIEGIDVNSEKDIKKAKYLENLLLGSSGNGKIRYGTLLSSKLIDTETRLFNEICHGNSFLKQDGTSENILYIKYFEKIPYITETDIKVIANDDGLYISQIAIDISSLTSVQQNYLVDRIFNDVRIYISQTDSPFIVDIFNFEIDETGNFLFTVKAEFTEFNIVNGDNKFELWYERAGLYKENATIPLIDDLDANTIVTSINYKNKLIFCNGVDPVLVYDGVNIVELLSTASVALTGEIVVEDNNITIKVLTNIKQEYENNLKLGSWIKFAKEEIEQENIITNVSFTDIENNLTQITITCQNNILAEVSAIIYKKSIPHFSYIAIANNRLWASAEGRPFIDKFRPSNLAQIAYYAVKQNSIDAWFDETTSNIPFIDLAVNNRNPENLEVIKFFQGKILFIGRHVTQVWTGNDVEANYDGGNISFGNFYLEKIYPVGILQKNLCQEMPNNFSIISNYGKTYSFILTKFGQLDVIENFMDSVGNFFELQLGFIENNTDYREMTSFLYSYANLIGMKIKNECIIYQMKNNGFWTVFTGNFSKAKSFFYNHIDKNLYFGMDKGTLVTYADKIENQSFIDYNPTNNNSSKIIWRLIYNWIYLDNLWINDKIDLCVTSLRPLVVNVKICENNNETDPIDDKILIDQKGSLLDLHSFEEAIYSTQNYEYDYETIKFKGDSFSLEFNGYVEDYFIFKKAILSGGFQNGN